MRSILLLLAILVAVGCAAKAETAAVAAKPIEQFLAKRSVAYGHLDATALAKRLSLKEKAVCRRWAETSAICV